MKIKSRNVYINEHFCPAIVSFNNGLIDDIIFDIDQECDIDYENKKILPGLVDIHCHGYMGYSSNIADKKGLEVWMKALPLEGCTSFVVTTSTAKEKDILGSLEIINEEIADPVDGANILGIHIEGPYISFDKCGAHNKYDIRKTSISEVKLWQKKAGNNILIYCIAPEMDEEHEMIKYCTQQGIKVAIGHTDASYREAISAIADGASDFTHTFNAMSQMLHRNPGVVGAAMDSVGSYCELITDGVHVDPVACRVLAKVKGKNKLIIITDSVEAKGLLPGTYGRDADAYVISKDGVIRKPDGTLAGSANSMNYLLYNAIYNIGIEEATAINAATINPCNFLGIKNKGKIELGRDADLTVLDNYFNVVQTYCKGKSYMK